LRKGQKPKTLAPDSVELREFTAKIGGEKCIFRCGTSDLKNKWFSRLTNTTTDFNEPESGGKRLTAPRPRTRKEALAIMAASDPQTEKGSNTLKSEFTAIPRVLYTGPKVSQNNNGPPRSPEAMLPSLMQRTPTLRANNFHTSINSPNQANAQQSGANPSVMYGSPSAAPRQTAPSLGYRTMASFRAMPLSPQSSEPPSVGGFRATESVLAMKLKDLESAIFNASKLDYIASGATGDYRTDAASLAKMDPPVFQFDGFGQETYETDTELPAMSEEYTSVDLSIAGDSPVQTSNMPILGMLPGAPLGMLPRGVLPDSPRGMLPGAPALLTQPGFVVRQQQSPGRAVRRSSVVATELAIKTYRAPPGNGGFLDLVGPARHRLQGKDGPKRPVVEAPKPRASRRMPSDVDPNVCTHLGNCQCPDCKY